MLVTLVLAGLATSAAGETVYKWVDARGQIHYSDLPPREPGARVLATINRAVGFADEEDGEDAAGAPPPPPPSPAFQDMDSDGDARAAAAVQRDVAAQRAEMCKQAQERYTQYIQSQRLFRTTPDGQRQYLSEAELTQARVDAKKAVDEYCGPGRP
jgi:hypothetical protein